MSSENDNFVGMSYCVDVAILIDATGSMDPIIGNVKENAIKFCDTFHKKMNEVGKNVDELRVKVIPFRDYKFDGDRAMSDSGFFSLPEQNDEFKNYVNNIEAMGGGDEPENALEAMALAMNSDWTKNGAKRRHVILVFTDASALPLKESERVSNPTYPDNMPDDIRALSDMWEGIDQSNGMPETQSARLVVYAPNTTPWSDIQVWDNVWFSPSKAGTGLEEVDMDLAIQLLVNSVG